MTLEELVDILCRPDLRQMVVALCEEAEEMHLNWRPGKKGIGPAWSPEEVAPELAQRLAAIWDALLDARALEELEGHEKWWWWEYGGDCDAREHWGRYVAQEVRRRLGLPLQEVFEDPRDPWDQPGANLQSMSKPPSDGGAHCLHPRLSLEVYTGVTGSADAHGDWMCVACGETFLSRAAAEKDRQRVRARAAKIADTRERHEGLR